MSLCEKVRHFLIEKDQQKLSFLSDLKLKTAEQNS